MWEKKQNRKRKKIQRRKKKTKRSWRERRSTGSDCSSWLISVVKKSRSWRRKSRIVLLRKQSWFRGKSLGEVTRLKWLYLLQTENGFIRCFSEFVLIKSNVNYQLTCSALGKTLPLSVLSTVIRMEFECVAPTPPGWVVEQVYKWLWGPK